MSFRFIYTHKTNKKTCKKIYKRKEKDSILAYPLKKNNISNFERASSFTSKGSLTLEAAFAIPIFFFAMLSIVYLLEVVHLQSTMRSVLHQAGRNLAEEAYMQPYISHSVVEDEIVELLGEDYIERSLLCGGKEGIDCSDSRMWGNSGIMDLSVRYQMEIPVLMFHLPTLVYKDELRIKGWNGYRGNGFSSTDEDIVYVTENGVVYHKDPECTYLDLSIQPIEKDLIDGFYNNNDEKYRPCEFCGKKPTADSYVYVTDYGARYHTSLQCKGLKRTVYQVPLSEVYGKGGCSKCVD